MKELLKHPAVIAILITVLSYFVDRLVNFLVNKWPQLRRLKLKARSQQVIALVDQWIKEQPAPPSKTEKVSKAKEIAAMVGIDIDKVNTYRRMIVDGWK